MNASRLRITFATVMSFMVMAVALLALGTFKNVAPAQADPSVIYVDRDAPGPAHNGLSWGTAYTNVQQALTTAISGTEIWVAEGVYYPGAYVTSTFALTDGVALYGGFAAAETQRTQRDWVMHVTVLSGDIDRNDITDANGIVTDTVNITGTNAYHVVTGSGVTLTAVLDGFTITAGKASGSSSYQYGGGMYNRGGSPQIANVTFRGNWAGMPGGGMYNAGSRSTLTNVTFSGNWAWMGGGMYNQGGSPTLMNMTFSGNRAGGTGGGMYNSGSSPTLTNVTFSGNQATAAGGGGGGMYNTYSSNPTLTNVTFSGNLATASGYGGGMYNYLSNPALTNVTFSSNQASYGGGMNNNSSNPTLANLTLSGNRAAIGGGMYNSGSSPTMVNVTVSGNRANVDGGGISNLGSSNPTLTNVTFSGNQAGSRGGGMYNEVSSPTLVNSILWGNSPEEISNNGSVTLITYSDVQSGYAGTGNIDADPLFAAPIAAAFAPTTTGNYRLRAGSPTIDAGNTLSVTAATDLDGNPRLMGAAVDMGAYEYYSFRIYLPIVFKN